MAATFGIDAQYSDVCVMLREWGGGRERMASVGDGRSALIPAAARDGLWGSAAALAILREGPADPGRLLCWRTDPWSAPFLTGLQGRLASYLGATGRHGGQPVVCAAPGTPPDVAQRCSKAGLGRATFVAPTDALLASWLHSAARLPGATPPADGRIVAVACGQGWTAVGAYLLERRAGALRIEATAEPSTLPDGCASWSADLARQVLDRCREGTAAEELLALRDATLECAAALRVHPTVEWTGTLAHRLPPEPLRVNRATMARHTEVVRLIAAVQRAVRGLVQRRALIVLGGVGAAWPFLSDALAAFGPVWQSSYPSRDLALGAASWPSVREAFVGRARPGAAALPETESAQDDQVQPRAARGPGSDQPDVPRWLR